MSTYYFGQIYAEETTRLAYRTDEAVEGRNAFLEKKREIFRNFLSFLSILSDLSQPPKPIKV